MKKQNILRKLIREEVKKVVAEMDAATKNSIIEPLVNEFDNTIAAIVLEHGPDDAQFDQKIDKLQQIFDKLIDGLNQLI